MKKFFSLLLSLIFMATCMAQIGSRMTTFNPAVNSFKFSNTLEVEIINDIKMSGFCGGMVYTALDYFKSRKPIPTQTYKPANGTPLYDYMWGRQRSSVIDNIDKWSELFINPFGSRTNEFFNWGLQGYGGGRLEELKKEIDKGYPVPLGLFKPGDGGAGPHHQVLAIGYNAGRYKGDLGANIGDLEIMVYDPNYPGVTKILKANTDAHIYYYKDEPDNKRCQWQTYFVNKKYNYSVPPTISSAPVSTDAMVKQFLLEVKTGADDLRGGNDNLNVTVNFKTKPSQTINKVNGGARWIGNYTETVPVNLPTPVPLNEFKSITLTTTFGGGVGGDNWNMDAVRVLFNDKELLWRSGTPVYRFTGSAQTLNFPLTVMETADGKIRELLLEISTGGDDLRGGNDNVNLTIVFKDGTKQLVNNLNKGTTWGGGSNKEFTVALTRYVPVTDIKSIVLTTTFGGGMGGDNWNMDRLRICARGGGIYKEIYKREGSPVKRFTGSDQNFTATATTE
jgi:hypothetical protein